MTNHEIIRTLNVLIHANEDRQRKAEAEALQSILDIFEQPDPDTVSRHAAVDAILKKPAWHNSDGSYYHSSDIKDALEGLPPAQPEPHWIPCNERLPDGKEYVLVTDYGETNIGRRFCGKWWLDYCGDKMKDVTAWMPLPEPYHDKGRTTTMRPED